ncbi:MAG: 16S rRNA (guanine(527)-N(7))-methyltransferase RsmG [Acidobacteriaceae bacterium]
MAHDAKPQLPPGAAAQLEAFLALLLRWNARMNLTAARDAETIVHRHFAESLFAAEHVPAGAVTLLDFGSGAGLPGIPIAIARPDIAVTLAESHGKKAAFLREAVRTLGLRAEVWDRRVEQMPAERIFDAVTLRAVEKMPQACKLAVPRLRLGGWLGVFTTRATESALDGLRGIRWGEALAIPGSRQEILRMGARADSAPAQ